MAILIEILILIVFSHLDRSLTRAGDSVLTTLVSRHASDAWQCNVRQCCTIFREGAYHLHTSSLKFSAKPPTTNCHLVSAKTLKTACDLKSKETSVSILDKNNPLNAIALRFLRCGRVVGILQEDGAKCLLWIFENIVKHHLHVWLRGGAHDVIWTSN